NITPAVTKARNWASLREAPALWAGRLCIYYTFLKTGLAGSHANPLVSDYNSFLRLGSGCSIGGSGDLGLLKWLETVQWKPDGNRTADLSGCQIRRGNAHGDSVCFKNVRALFDELPTPHLTVEITSVPAGPLSEKDYIKAEKLEEF
ncbi:uncharacterized protein LOC111284334, partial [Durio zibethinus]|uniref:Uncharacterized protein LOC111284334 n=1 Tax=Durio zibethinus TaxID=66656 RepID=A0A6P5XLH6_DURZI